MMYARHPPPIFARLAALEDSPSPSQGAGDIAIFIYQPNTSSAQGDGRLIDSFPSMTGWVPSLFDSSPNHREILAFVLPTQCSQKREHHVSTTPLLKVAKCSDCQVCRLSRHF